jgi:type IV pilus assembly protein PilW
MTHRRRFLHGHTLLELMIATGLGLVVTVGAVSLYRSQRAAFVSASDAAHIEETGVGALTLLGQQIQMAGFTAADAVSATATATNANAALFGCSGARPVGANEAPGCEALASHSDGIVVRYMGDNVSTWPSATGQPTDCLGQAVSGVAGQGAAAGVPVTNRFYAKPSGSSGEPELYCEGNGKTGYGQPLVEGVERLRIQYWPAGASQPLDASALTLDQWARVVAVDLCVLVRGAPLGRRMRYVDCDGVVSMGGDTRARQAFWRRVALRNTAGASP